MSLLLHFLYKFSLVAVLICDCFQIVHLQGEEAPIDDLMELVQQIVAFHMKVWYIIVFI